VSATACVAVAAEQLNLIVISSVCIRLFDKDIRQIIRLKSVLLLHPKIKTSNWMNAFWLLVSCWLNCVLTQPLELAQYTALMTVYDALGSSHADEVKSFCRSLFGFFRGRMQRDIVPAIQCIVELHWFGVDLFWWQSHSVVRSRQRCVVSLRN
jgi:hypothetical protein